MFRQVLIARLRDGLYLVEDRDNDPSMDRFCMQAKKLVKKFGQNNTPKRCTLNTDGRYLFHCYIEGDVTYLVLCDSSFSSQLAFGFLEALQREFHQEYGSQVADVTRPYKFITFDRRIQSLKRQYEDSRASHRGLNRLDRELHDVTRIMKKNIDDVLDRKERLDDMSSKASALKDHSISYKKATHKLKWDAIMQKFLPLAAVCLIVLLLLYFYYA